MAATRLGFAGRRGRDTANPAGFIASPVTNAAYAAHEYACLAGYTNWEQEKKTIPLSNSWPLTPAY